MHSKCIHCQCFTGRLSCFHCYEVVALKHKVKQDENCVAQSLLDKETSKYTFFARKIRKNTIRFEATASSSVEKGNCKLCA